MNRFRPYCLWSLLIVILLAGGAWAFQDYPNPAEKIRKLDGYKQQVADIQKQINAKADRDKLFDLLRELSSIKGDISRELPLLQAQSAHVAFGQPLDRGGGWDKDLLKLYETINETLQSLIQLHSKIQSLESDIAIRHWRLRQKAKKTTGNSQPAGSKTSKVKVTNASGQGVAGLKISIRHGDGNKVATTDEKGEAPVSTAALKDADVVISGPNRSDIHLSQSNVQALESQAARCLVMEFDRLLTTEEEKKVKDEIAKAAEKQTGQTGLVVKRTNFVTTTTDPKTGKESSAYVFQVYPPGTAVGPIFNPLVDPVLGESEGYRIMFGSNTPAGLSDPAVLPLSGTGFENAPNLYGARLTFPVPAAAGTLPIRICGYDQYRAASLRTGCTATGELNLVKGPGGKTRVAYTPELKKQVGTMVKTFDDLYTDTVGPSVTVPSDVLNLGKDGKTPVVIFETYFFNDADFFNPDGTPKIDFVELNDKVAEAAKQNPLIKQAELQVTLTADAEMPNDPHFGARGSWKQAHFDQWALRRVGFTPIDAKDSSAWPVAWSKDEMKLAPTVVAVIGSGIDFNHPDLLGHVWMNLEDQAFNGKDDDGNGYVDDLFGWNFRDGTNNAMDFGGHDTHIAGVIAARWNNGRGIAGINPAAWIMSLKVGNYLGEADSLSVSRAVKYAVDHGARVINISYTGPRKSHIFQLAVDYAVSNDVLVVVAAGNQGEDAANRCVASANGVLTVAGTTVEGKRVGFSNWGQPIDIAAPAMDVLGLRARGSDFLLDFAENPDYEGGSAIVGKEKDLYRAGGTSFCSPIVAGTASLLWSLNPKLTSEQVKRKLLMSAEEIEVPGWDQYTGQGLLNAKKAITADPDYYLFTRISRLAPARRGGQVYIDVFGKAEGSEFTERRLQIGFGEKPEPDDWITVQQSTEAVTAGQLGSIPASRFSKAGVWTVRVLAQDKRKLSRESRARLDLN